MSNATHRCDSRPYAFLVSTTPCAGGIQQNLGAPAYSYYYVLEALAPILERCGVWRLIDRPESRLTFAAARAEANGFRPVHLAINPPQDCYLTPALPNILFPFWEFPDVPNRNFGHDTRQNWTRTCRRASLILTACQFTAEAIRRSGVSCPIEVVPIPLNPAFFELPDWDARHTWTISCRHELLGPSPASVSAAPASAAAPPAERSRSWGRARHAFRQVAPWLHPETVGRLTRLKNRLRPSRLAASKQALYQGVRNGYKRYVRPWLSDGMVERVTAIKNAAFEITGISPGDVANPLLPSTPLTLGGGLVYTSLLNLSDRRKNHIDLLTAFLIAFRDRPDVTLVLKLATNPQREHLEMEILREQYHALGLRHACRVVALTDYLDDGGLTNLMRVTTYYVNTSHAEGACLPLQRALAGGRPAIAPDHTAMADYMDDAIGFVPRSAPEPAFWPHDPEQRLETSRYRLVWSDLCDHFRASARVAQDDQERYVQMAQAARLRMRQHAGRSVAEAALRSALDHLIDSPLGSFDWAARRTSVLTIPSS